MNLLDVNVLIYAFRRDAARHEEHRAWLVDLSRGSSAFGLTEGVLAAVLRLTTHPRVFREPSSLAEAAAFVEALRSNPRCRMLRPDAAHWPLFLRLCRRSEVRGNLVTDAWYAALAIQTGCTWVTTDRDFARFPGLTWRHPLDQSRDVVNPDL